MLHRLEKGTETSRQRRVVPPPLAKPREQLIHCVLACITVLYLFDEYLPERVAVQG